MSSTHFFFIDVRNPVSSDGDDGRFFLSNRSRVA